MQQRLHNLVEVIRRHEVVDQPNFNHPDPTVFAGALENEVTILFLWLTVSFLLLVLRCLLLGHKRWGSRLGCLY